MQCDNAQLLISSWIAVEIEDKDFQALSKHLSECGDCRTCTMSWLLIDRRLTRAISPKRTAADNVADRVIAQLPVDPSQEPARPQVRTPPWLSIVVAAAAGFLMAVLLFDPWKQTDAPTAFDQRPAPGSAEEPPPATQIARLIAATGPVRMRPHGSASWTEVTPASAFDCGPETELATGPRSRCEIVTADGNVLRMNSDTRLIVETENRIRIQAGQIFCRAAVNSGLEVIADSDIADDRPGPVVNCPSQASFLAAWLGSDVQIHASTGQLTLITATGEHSVKPGQLANIGPEGIVKAQHVAEALLAVGWMDTLLVRGPHQSPDLDLRVNALLAQVGRTKASYLYERELRGLGEHCVLPLTRFVMSEISGETPARRLMSMRVVADASPSWNIENLIALLSDHEPDIRVLAATALRRLTGETNGRAPEQWRTELQPDDPILQKWSDWWSTRGELYPGPEATAAQHTI